MPEHWRGTGEGRRFVRLTSKTIGYRSEGLSGLGLPVRTLDDLLKVNEDDAEE